MTTAYTDWDRPVVAEGVYPPQEDSQLLIDVMDKTGLARGSRVADLCTGSGVAAIAAAEQGAVAGQLRSTSARAQSISRVSRLSSPESTSTFISARGHVQPNSGPSTWWSATRPTCRTTRAVDGLDVPSHIGPPCAWDAGYDGRLVLDPLCASMRSLLADGGTLLLVQSEFAEPRKTLAALASCGLDAEIVAWQWIPFGPVLSARAQWLEDTGRLEPGTREEELVVIRADRA